MLRCPRVSTRPALLKQSPLLLSSLVLYLSFWMVPAALAAIKYVPPRQPSSPKTTRPAITRGGRCTPEEQGQLTLLAPLSHVGQTISKRPTVTWYVPDRISYGLEVRLFNADGQRLHRTVMQSQPGIMRFSLPAEQPELSVGQYRWQLVLLCNPGTPSLNVATTAEIAVVEPTPALKTQLSVSKTPQQRIEQYATNGFWYDALASAVSQPNPQSQSTTAALLNSLADVEAPGLKEWSDRLRQVATRLQQKQAPQSRELQSSQPL